jgi:hypothetical protein
MILAANIDPAYIPNIPVTPGNVGGAGNGNLANENISPVTSPTNKDIIAIFIKVPPNKFQ